jgi:phosphoribosylformylglycinamidine cyclo-ligase
LTFSDKAAVCVVLASESYPAQSDKEYPVVGLAKSDFEGAVFHAGVKESNCGNTILTSGGRVVSVMASADNLQQAASNAYEYAKAISFQGKQYRSDIAQLHHDPYAQAGVDIEAGNSAVFLMSEAIRSTYGKEVLAGIGAFGGMYDAQFIKGMRDPVLVASIDGVGTKVKLATALKRFRSLGHDIVNHSVNDILVQGAKPLFFLDYVASSKLEPKNVAEIVSGMAESCRAVSCALLGGETAEMPSVYSAGSIDVAGTIIGIVERADALPKSTLKAGDILLGLRSSGPHTNGYSLIRSVFANTSLDHVYPELKEPLGDALLKPHRCYLPTLNAALHSQLIKALVHITGGGFYENIPRVLPQGLKARLKRWPIPPLFKLIQEQGDIDERHMYRVFNMGIGMVIIAAPHDLQSLQSQIDEPLLQIGELIEGSREVIFS